MQAEEHETAVARDHRDPFGFQRTNGLYELRLPLGLYRDWYKVYMGYSLNSLKGGYIGGYIGDYIGDYYRGY